MNCEGTLDRAEVQKNLRIRSEIFFSFREGHLVNFINKRAII